MGVFSCIIVGFVAGWIAERIAGRDHNLFTNIVVGVIGALIGGLVFTRILGFRYDPGINLASIAVATVGAVLFLAVFGGLRQRQTRL